jgi:hypothetical protein
MERTDDLRTSLAELIADYAKCHDASVGFIVAELDHVRAITPELADGAEPETIGMAPTTPTEHPAQRLGRLFRTACDRGLRRTRAMDCAARTLMMWDNHPSEESPELLEQLSRCADAVDLLLARHTS